MPPETDGECTDAPSLTTIATPAEKDTSREFFDRVFSGNRRKSRDRDCAAHLAWSGASGYSPPLGFLVRILHVSPTFHPAWAYGGIPRCAYELCRSLVSLGESVTVWTTDAFDETQRLHEPETVVDAIFVRRFRNLHN